MRSRLILLTLLVAMLAAPALAAGPAETAIEIDVRIEPTEHTIKGEAVLHITGHGEMKLHVLPTVTIEEIVLLGDAEVPLAFKKSADPHFHTVTFDIPEGAETRRLKVSYGGTIYDAVEKSDALAFVIGDDTRGVIGTEGIFLVNSSGWFPQSRADVKAFPHIRVNVPAEFRVVTQGGLLSREVVSGREITVWGSDIPVDGLALQGGRYEVATREVEGVSISTYLFAEQAKHAPFLLGQVERYIRIYNEILGPFPWPKFDIVSNFFTTGYGMPTYTLLGASVVDVMVRMSPRYGGNLPPGFVDHELVHCYWGNFVYPDYETGNWCEGLTSYCANYLMKERQDAQSAAAHREKASTNFAIRVTPANDYPVREFRGKTEDFDNDIGYSKAMMLFHMLRRRVGDGMFWETLRGVVRDFGGKKTSWADFEAAFSKASGQDLSWFFAQWLGREGAPHLSAGDFTVTRLPSGLYEVKGEVLQDGEPWRLLVPVTVEHAGGESFRHVPMNSARAQFTIVTPEPPLSVSVDKRFHLFRHVPMEEIQPCLNLTMECKEKTYVLPAEGDAYRGLAMAAMSRKGGEFAPVADGLPAGHTVLFGTPEENPAVAEVLKAVGVTVEGKSVTIRGRKHEADDLWVLLSTRNPKDETKFVTVFFGVSEAALARARVIFHFGWDGHLVYGNGRPLARGDFTPVHRRTVRTLALGPSLDNVQNTLQSLTAKKLGGRLAGSEGDLLTRQLLHGLLMAAGLRDIEGVPFGFTVRDHTDQDAWTVAQGTLEDGSTKWKTSFPGAVLPVVWSPANADGVRIRKIAKYGHAVDSETLVVLPPETNPDGLMLLVASAVADGPAAVAIPMEVLQGKDRRMADLVGFPSREDKAENPWLTASGRQARAPRPFARVGKVPVVFLDRRLLPPEIEGPADALLRVRFEERTVQTANLTGVIPDRNGRTEGAGPALSAHFDGLGEGHQGADDNASGIAAVIEAARLLRQRSDLIGRPIRVYLFGAEEWGLRGSAAAAADVTGVERMVNLDTVGANDAPDVYLIGRSHYPDLAGLAADCLRADGFDVGRDIDRFAFAHGSDHYSFHEKGIPAIDIFSGQYRRMNTKADVLDLVDIEKVTRLAESTARLMFALASEELPVPVVKPVTMFENEKAHLVNVRQLTSGGENAEAYFPAECDRFCFQSKRGDMAADQIFTMDLDGGNQRMVSNGKGATTCSYLFPGSKRVIYATTAFHGDEPPAPPDRSKGYVWKLHPEFDLVVHDLDGKNQIRLTDTWGYDAEATVSPDGEWIVFTSCRDGGDPEVYKMKADGSELTRLTNAEGYDGGPFFSWDGKSIIWRANRPKSDLEKEQYRSLKEEGLVSPINLEIFIMDVDGTNQRQVTKNGAANFAPFLHPDNKRIIFCSNLATLGKRGMPNFDLWMINVDGTGLTRITTCPDFDGFPMFTRDGKTLVFCSNRDNGGTRDTNVFLADWKD
jgi:TolB protein